MRYKLISFKLGYSVGFEMSTIDLERLRAIHDYFVPIKREELREKIFKELDKSIPSFYGVEAWTIEEHGNSLHFFTNYPFLYILGRLKLDVADIAENVKKLRTEIEKLKGIQLIQKSMEFARRSSPSDIYVNIKRCEGNGCEIEVECTSILYRRISQLAERNVDDCELQDAYISCERFIRTIFLGGLSGTPLSEKKTTLQKDSTILLINDISHRQVTEKLEDMFDNATGEILIFGYMGTIFVNKLRELKQKGVKIKLITGNIKAIRQDEMRKEKEKAIEELVSIIGKDNISSKSDFHGRAITVDNKALVGSMDLDSYSMTGARIEFAIYTENPEIVREVRSYFARVFKPWKEGEEEKPK
jgi:HKD family nuclease